MNKMYRYVTLCLALFFTLQLNAQSIDTIAYWHFNDYPTAGVGGPDYAVYHLGLPDAGEGDLWVVRDEENTGFVTARRPGNGSGYGFRFTGFRFPGEDGFVIKINTSGLSGINLSFDQLAGTGTHTHRHFKIQYSTDSVTFTDLPGAAYELEASSSLWTGTGIRDLAYMRSFVLEALNYQPQAYIKITLNAMGGATEPNFIYLDNILITGTPDPLAISLLDISAQNRGEDNLIRWSTAGEDEGDYFEVQRSEDGKEFSTVAIVEAAGSYSTYRFIDEQPHKGVNFYRLKMPMNGAAGQYSKVVTAHVPVSLQGEITIYPNPVGDRLNIRTQEKVHVSILSLDGRKLIESYDSDQIDVSSLMSGIYIIQVYNGADGSLIRTEKLSKR